MVPRGRYVPLPPPLNEASRGNTELGKEMEILPLYQILRSEVGSIGGGRSTPFLITYACTHIKNI